MNLHFYKQNFICKKDSRDWENPWNFLIYSSICVKKKNKAGLAISSLGPSQNGYFNWKTLVDTLSVSIGHSLYLSNGFFLFISNPPPISLYLSIYLSICLSIYLSLSLSVPLLYTELSNLNLNNLLCLQFSDYSNGFSLRLVLLPSLLPTNTSHHPHSLYQCLFTFNKYVIGMNKIMEMSWCHL